MTRQSPYLSVMSTAGVAITALLFLIPTSVAEDVSTHRFEISFPTSAHSEPITGRVYVMISRTNEKEPRLQIGRTGVPFFGRDVERLAPGSTATIDETDLGSPVASLREIPLGDYYVQAFVNIYSEFRRADGHVVWMHDDQWEGQHFNRSPGNLMSDVQQVHLDPEAGYNLSLEATNVIPPIEIRSRHRMGEALQVREQNSHGVLGTAHLSRCHGAPPQGLRPRDHRVPRGLLPGPLLSQDPMRFKEGEEFYQEWIKDGFPRMMVVTFQDPTPYFDTSYSVNSVNVGPYGDAIMQELIPEVEKRFRIIKEPYARILTGGSTGGWESLAMMIFYPDFFGGTFSYSPDPVTFTNVEGINIYEDVNAFYKQHEWRQVPTPNTRESRRWYPTDLQTAQSLRAGLRNERALGTTARYLVRGPRTDRRRRLLQAAYSTNSREISIRRWPSTGRKTSTCSIISRRTGRR